ncbi:MAG TPA: flagellar protein FlgN [Burkholderiales bacterium]|nr:flagellar protein FlgN [Burkholderiales bacterium]
MSLAQPPDRLASLVREFELELLHVRQMIALAQEEHRDLVAGNTARLDAISSEKLVQLRAVELYVKQRCVHLVALGFSPDADGLAACIASAGRLGRKLTAAWSRLTRALAELAELNEENGALLRGCLAAVGDGPDPVAPGAAS